MTYEQQRTTVERDIVDPAYVDDRRVPTGRVVGQREATGYRPSGSTLASRVTIVVFGIIQALLLVRIVLLLLDARRGNDLVTAILGASQIFVAPFEGMFRVDALGKDGSVLDVAAIAALVALTIVELIILAILRIPRRTESV
jgi:hypothetical protein